ncbi:MAG TPA: sugar ABC transporter substrate-binding protein, partial [Burkholderiaceae bacterium]|nr:sugar ABC transporter substrate-binding protein [Burkholderiaceae bacterium]
MLRRGAGVMAAAVALPGCARRGDPHGPLDFWAMGREAEVVTELLVPFRQRHPGIEVRLQQLPWTAAHEKLLTAYAGDALPDVCTLGNTWIPEFAALDALEPLDERVAASRVIQRDDYYAGILETNLMPSHGRDHEGSRGGAAMRLRGLPWYVDTRLLYYRSDLLRAAGVARAPQSWAEWRDAMAAIVRRGGPHHYGALLPLNEPEPLLALAFQQGDVLADGATRGAFSRTPFRRAIGFYAELFDSGLAPLMTNTQVSNVWDEFARGLFTFYISGPWNIGEFRRRLPRERQNDWATAPLPGPDGPGVSTAGGTSLVLFTSSPRKEAGWKLIEFLSETATQQRFHALTGNLPPRRSAWADPGLANDAPSRAFADQLERVRAAPKIPEWERIFQEMQATAERVVRHTQGAAEATAQLDAWVDAVLEKRRWLLAKGRG